MQEEGRLEGVDIAEVLEAAMEGERVDGAPPMESDEVAPGEAPEREAEGYRTQREVDVAFGKRLAAERKKWEQAHAQEREALRGSTDALIRSECERQELEEEDVRTGMEAGKPLGEALEEASRRKWARGLIAEEEEIRKTDEGFDLLRTMRENPDFAQLVSSGQPLRKVYDFFHMDERVRDAAEAAEQRVVQRIQRRGLKPMPMRAGAGGAARVDMAALSEAELRRIDERLKRGEKVRV